MKCHWYGTCASTCSIPQFHGTCAGTFKESDGSPGHKAGMLHADTQKTIHRLQTLFFKLKQV